MSLNVVIRNKTETDVNSISEVTVAAFKTLEISNQTEQYIIGALRNADALTLSLVAELDGRIVGHPEYYKQFGFTNVPGLIFDRVPKEAFFALSFIGRMPEGKVRFHESFMADGRNEGETF